MNYISQTIKSDVRRSLLLASFIFFVSLQLFSQDSTSANLLKNHTIQLNVLNLFAKDVSIRYSYFFKKNMNVDFTAGYRLNSKNSGNEFPLNQFKDPFWYYNHISAQVGIGYYFQEHFYMTPTIILNYSFFDNKYFSAYEDFEGELYDVSYEISRNKKAIGGLVKAGYCHSYKKLRIDFFIGVGIKYIYKTEAIYKKLDFWNEIILEPYPLRNYSSSVLPVIYPGIQIGFKL